jgi:hypothetical protein
VQTKNHPSAKENPGALGGATGADLEVCDRLESYRVRHGLATLLCRTIDACHPRDAAAIMVAALGEIGAGAPPPTIRKPMVEARAWARDATVYELRAYAAACVEAMPAEDLTSFLAFVAERFPAKATEAAR